MSRNAISILFVVILAVPTVAAASEIAGWTDETGNPRSLADLRGEAYGTFDDELRAVGGIRWRLPLGFTVGGIYDGEQLHLIGEYRFRKHVFSVLWVELEDLGVAYSIAF